MVIMLTLYGIKNCDTVKKAQMWLTEHHIEYCFHDYKSAGVSRILLEQFAEHVGWNALVNKRSTTWRTLTDDQKNDLEAEKTLLLLLDYPTLIKRPILQSDTIFMIGFNADDYQRKL
jgi:arsenate reductase (glutaredoxin)